MRKRPFKRFGISFGLVAAAVFLILWLAGTEPKAMTRPPESEIESAPFGEMDDLVFTRTVAGAPQGIIVAKHALYYNDRGELDFEHVDGHFYDNSHTLIASSERGSMNLKNSRGVLTGNVVCRTDDGSVLHTPRLDFDTETKQLHTDEPILLEGPNFTLTGVGADADLTIQRVQINQQIQAKTWDFNAPH